MPVEVQGALGHIQDGTVLLRGVFGGLYQINHAEEEITLSTGGLTTDSTMSVTAGTQILATPCRITTTVTTSSAVKSGTDAGVDTTVGTDFGALTAGTTNKGTKGCPHTTAAATVKVRITAVTSNPGAGKVRAHMFYLSTTAPTS